MRLRFLLTVIFWFLPKVFSYADIMIYSVGQFQSITPVLGEEYHIQGFMAEQFQCPPCPKDAVCATCPEEYAIVSDLPQIAKANRISVNELKINTENIYTDNLKKWTKYLFTIMFVQRNAPEGQFEMVNFKEFKEEDVDDLSIKVTEELICTDDTQAYNCKPRIIDAIDKDDLKTVQELIAGGFDSNMPFPVYYGTTAFMHAVKSGHVEIAVYMLENGADPSKRIPIDPVKEARAQGLDRLSEQMQRILNNEQ